MPIIVIQHPLKPQEREVIQKEFPYFGFRDEKSTEMEVFFGSSITKEEIEESPLLRWIHLPNPQVHHLPLQEIQRRGNILVTFTPSSEIDHHGEWAIASALSLLKGFFGSKPPLSLSNLTWLELYIEGERAISNAKWAKKLGFKVFGMQKIASFAPFTDRTFSLKDRSECHLKCDVISLTTDPKAPEPVRLAHEELSLLKNGSILIISTSLRRVDWNTLDQMIQANHFQGVAIDSKEQVPLTPHPQLLITPGISLLPTPTDDPSFPLFRHLLRDYLHDNFVDMAPRLET